MNEPARGGEDELIDWLKRRTAGRGEQLIGDDAAVLPPGAWAVTMDSQIEGVHFIRGLDEAIVARRLLAVNLSDLAAVGASPRYAFLALAAPSDFDHRRFFSALTKACQSCSLTLAGGDLSSHSRVTAVLTLLGDRPEDRRWLSRAGALAGEDLWLGGTVGEAAVGLILLQRGMPPTGPSSRNSDQLGLPNALLEAARRAVQRQLAPRPQLELGSWLGSCPSGAAIDISDGLGRDLHRLCSLSGVGAEVVLENLPLATGHKRLARTLGCDWRQLALAGGEDYVLLFTLPAGTQPPGRFGCTRIGSIVDQGITLRTASRSVSLPASGWDHLAPGR